MSSSLDVSFLILAPSPVVVSTCIDLEGGIISPLFNFILSLPFGTGNKLVGTSIKSKSCPMFWIIFLQLGKGAILSNVLCQALSVFPWTKSLDILSNSYIILPAGKAKKNGCLEPGPTKVLAKNSGNTPDKPDSLNDSAHHVSVSESISVTTSPYFAISLNSWIPP